MLTRFLLIGCLSLLFTSVYAQEDSIITDDMFVEKEFVIILSTKDYNAALRMAKDAAARLQYNLDLRDLKANKESGLTFDRQTCEDEGGYPCYMARGRGPEGDYVSIEYSDAYKGFTKGYYIVIVSDGARGSTEVKTALTKAKSVYKTAYAKSTTVYIGCMH